MQGDGRTNNVSEEIEICSKEAQHGFVAHVGTVSADVVVRHGREGSEGRDGDVPGVSEHVLFVFGEGRAVAVRLEISFLRVNVE